MNRLSLVTLAAFLFSKLLAASTNAPNIILFFVDDFGQRDLSCYGSSFYETPHMDRLAADGMRFTEAYSAYPRCVPSRKGLLSGKYPSRIDFAIEQSGDRAHQLPLSEVTFGEALKAGGYDTAYMGKWHLGKEGGDPGAQGFDTVVHAGSAGAPGDYFYPFPLEKNLMVVNPLDGQPGDYLTDRLTDRAVEYIHAKRAKPFLLVLAHYAVHTPLQAPEAMTAKYRSKLQSMGLTEGGTKEDDDFIIDRQGVVKTAQNNPTYAAMIESVDTSLGRLMDALEAEGIASNTVIVLTSDHGGLSTRGLENQRVLATSNAPLRQGKGSIFEGGTRVPLIVKWPGKVAAGSTSSVQVTGTDHYPTFLEMAGLSLRPQQHVDGQSYLRALQGERYERKGLFWYKWQARPDSTGDTRALSYLKGNYKIIEWLDEDLVELFNLETDISERTNLAEKMPETTRTLLAELRRMENEVGNLREKGRQILEKRLNGN